MILHQLFGVMLTNVSQSSSRDKLAVTAMKFLTTVSTSVHHTLFANDGVIPQICQSIVIPNVRLRDEDEELFEMNYVEFIRRGVILIRGEGLLANCLKELQLITRSR